MAVRKICKQKGCRASPRCEHPWWFDVMHEGRRWRMPVNDFAIPRGATEPVTSKQTAEKVWEPKLLAEILAGRDPRVSPAKPKREGVTTVADFLDEYFTSYVEAEGLKSLVTIHGHIKQLKEALGELPVTALEKTPDIARFKAQYRKGRTLATVNRALGVPRAAVNWGRFRAKPGARVDRPKLREIDLHWHDMRHEGACRLLADGVDIRVVQLILGHSDIKTTQRYLNITDEELRRALTGVWERRRQLKAVGE